MKTKFYYCSACGNVIMKNVDSGVTPVCCGREMWELHPNNVDASKEKHVPVITRMDDCTIRVAIGSQPHPMTPDHHINFIFLETEQGGQIRYFKPDEPSVAMFCGCKDQPIAAFAYCNLHGLWMDSVIQGTPEQKGTCCCPTKEQDKQQ